MNMEKIKRRHLKMWEWNDKYNKREQIKFNVEELKDVIKILNQNSYEPVDIGLGNPYAIYFSNQQQDLYLRSISAPIQTLVIVKIKVSPIGQGIGTNILNALINYAKTVGFDRIVMENVTSKEGLNFVERKGFNMFYNPSRDFLPDFFKSDIADYEMILYYDFEDVVPMRISTLCEQYNTTIYGISKIIKDKYNKNIQSTINEIMQKRTKVPTISTIFYITEALGIRLSEFFNDPKFNQIDGIANLDEKNLFCKRRKSQTHP